MSDCIFCAIADGSIPVSLVAETANTVAFPDMSPKADLHVLVIPREHHENVGALAAANPAVAAELLTTAARVAAEQGVAANGYRLIANTGAGGGQTVFHAHLHLLAGPELVGF